MHGLTIGDVAKQADVHIETLRYYERRGLVARPPRSLSNYRLYPEDTVRRVRFIKHAQALGFSLKEIKELLSLRAVPQTRCTAVRERAVAKIHDIEDKIRALQAMKKALTKPSELPCWQGSWPVASVRVPSQSGWAWPAWSVLLRAGLVGVAF